MQTPSFNSPSEIEAGIKDFNSIFEAVESQVRHLIVGMEDVLRLTMGAVFAGGHVLLEGAPGLGKTRLVRAIAQALGLNFRRIQFTPDLMPSDVTGTQILTEDDNGKRRFVFKPGPIFANIVLADEINRATPKTQSSLLEAMEEHQVSVLGETHRIAEPFFVLATQNPIELEGTYPLPEAQLDRFLFKLLLKHPSSNELKEILNRTTGASLPEVKCVMPPEQVAFQVKRMQLLVRHVAVADPFLEIIVRMLSALTPGDDHATQRTDTYVRFGPGPRGAQSVILGSKVCALLDGRINVSFDDIRAVLVPALRHRLILNFQAEADAISADDILEEVRSAK